jgi:hypothetical protein
MCCCMCCFSGTTITHGASKRGGDSPAMNHMWCQQARWRSPCIATKASTVLTIVQLHSTVSVAHTIVQLPCIATKAIIMPCSYPATQQGHDCFCWAKGRKAPLDKPSCCNLRRCTRKSCRHGSVISWSVTLHRSMGPRSIFQLSLTP